jgi:uncharacterized protein YaaN involved in tellurite resistance
MSESLRTKPLEELTVPSTSQIGHDLEIHKTQEVIGSKAADPKLVQKADQLIAQLLAVDISNQATRERAKASVEQLGLELQKRAGVQSEKLKDPIRKLTLRSGEGSTVANALIDLRVQVEALDPARFSLDAGWFSRIVGYLPGVGTPLKRYFTKYESAQTVINAVIRSLEDGREQLKRDNVTLTDDQRMMREMIDKIESAIALGQVLDAKLQAQLDNEIPQTDPRYAFIAEELLFPLRQRIMDLQQQLAVNQQGILAMEIIIRNNKELIRGVNRALNVTVNALRVAVTVALALADQQIVLEKVTALNQTTNELIANTAQRLRTQGTEIQKSASQTQLDMETLKAAFVDINEALQELARFRQEALPQMASSILEMERLTDEASQIIAKKERAARVEPIIPLEVE